MKRLLVAGVVALLLVACGSDKKSSDDTQPAPTGGVNAEGLSYLNGGETAGEYIVKYRGADLHCLQGGHLEHDRPTYFVVCDFVKFYAEHPNFLPRSGK